jgi:hypothetical protein
MPSKYYDLDSILAEDELLPCTALFNFSHLGHLDPDNSNGGYLQEESKIQMPLWAMKKWSQLGYVKVQVPRHFNNKARERLEADPSAVDLRYVAMNFFVNHFVGYRIHRRGWAWGRELMSCGHDLYVPILTYFLSIFRKRNSHFFLTGHCIVTLLEQCATPLVEMATTLRKTLLSSYTTRLRQTLDWSWSSVNDDVSHYLQQLTSLERHLFRAGASAMGAHAQWKAFGSRTSIFMSAPKNKKDKTRAVTPDQHEEKSEKRQRVQ